MNKYLSIFNVQTLLIIGFSMISSYICLKFQLTIYLDFLILGIMIIFPITFSLRSAFRRRERALQYLSFFKATLQSVYYTLQSSKLANEKKNEFRNIAENVSGMLLGYLASKPGDAMDVQEASHAIYRFIQSNKADLKRTLSVKLFLFLFRINESIEFLLATRRHRTPWGPRAIVLFGIYSFVIFYPASLLHDVGPGVQLWYLMLSTAFKGLLFISLYNVEALLEDPFDQRGPDGIRLDDFGFYPGTTFTETSPSVAELMPAEEQTEEIDDEL